MESVGLFFCPNKNRPSFMYVTRFFHPLPEVVSCRRSNSPLLPTTSSKLCFFFYSIEIAFSFFHRNCVSFRRHRRFVVVKDPLLSLSMERPWSETLRPSQYLSHKSTVIFLLYWNVAFYFCSLWAVLLLCWVFSPHCLLPREFGWKGMVFLGDW